MISRITMAAIAAATTIALSAPAEASHHRTAQSRHAPGFVDAAAIPAYPTDRQARGHRVGHRAATHRVASTTSTYQADDEDSRQERPPVAASRGGIVRSHKTGATAHVGARYASMFQGYVDALEATGATIRFMGGIRRGRCSSGSMHPCGKALDVCQLSRDRVDSRCHLPGRDAMARIAAANGLFEGGQWCHGDMGHAQVGVSAAACGSTMMARRHHRHHRIRYARR